jgi:hypothetical protein
VLFLPDDGLVEGFGGGPLNRSLPLLLSAWISLPAVEGMVAKMKVGPDSLQLKSGVISMARAEGIPRIASVREATMNRSAIIGMPTRCSMVVLMSMQGLKDA